MPRDFLPSLPAALLLAVVAVLLDIHRLSDDALFSPLAICEASCGENGAPLVRSRSVNPTQRPVLRRVESIPIDPQRYTASLVGRNHGGRFFDKPSPSYKSVIPDLLCEPFSPGDKANFTQAASNAVIYFTLVGVFKIHSASSIALAPAHFQMTRASPFYFFVLQPEREIDNETNA
jgi:hypothetical protein